MSIPHSEFRFSSIRHVYPRPVLSGPFLNQELGQVLSVFLGLLVPFSSSSQSCLPPHLPWPSSDLPPTSHTVPETAGALRSLHNYEVPMRPIQAPCHSSPSNALGDDDSVIINRGEEENNKRIHVP